MSIEILVGDVRDRLADLPDRSVQCIVTSPPYFGLRDYGVEGQIGLEASLDGYIDQMVAVCRDLRRVLRDDGVFWLNIGDSYSGAGTTGGVGSYDGADHRTARMFKKTRRTDAEYVGPKCGGPRDSGGAAGHYVDAPLPAKNLLMVPARLAIALQSDGWFLRSDVIWHKPNPMPESVTDRPTSAHEHVFLLTKSARYYYDSDAVRQPPAAASIDRLSQDVDGQTGSDRAYGGDNRGRPMKAKAPARRKPGLNSPYSPPGQTPHMGAQRANTNGKHQRGHAKPHEGFDADWDQRTKEEQTMYGANLRNVWTIATHPYRGAHFATFPPELPKRCILAGSKEGDTILDPFGGAMTTMLVADRLGRNGIAIELNPEYAEIGRKRLTDESPLFAAVDVHERIPNGSDEVRKASQARIEFTGDQSGLTE